MKTFKILLTVLLLLSCNMIYADFCYVNGICYYYKPSSTDKTVKVSKANIHQQLSGELVIPETVKIEGVTYNVTSIGDQAFMDCTGLTSVRIPNCVTMIGANTFTGCTSLSYVAIANNETIIGANAFLRTAWYEQKPDGVIYIGKCLYKYKGIMPSNTSIIVNDGIICISSGAFEDCKYLTSIVIPNSVRFIGSSAFNSCQQLTSVTIPVGLTSIENATFSNCDALTSVIIPNSVTNIGSFAFEGCNKLTSVTIGSSVTSIGEDAFLDCYRLTNITSLSKTPPVINNSDTFDNYNSATLYVPSGTKSAYSTAEYWKKFTNIVEFEMSYELTDGEEYNEISDKTVDALVYTRTLPNLHWNALYVPFELPYDVVAEHYDVAYINDVNGYDTDDNGEIDDLAMEIIKIKSGTLKANYPYLIKAKTEADKAMSITLEDATLYAAEENSVDCSSVYQNYVVKGTYTKKSAEELAGKLAISTSGAWQPLAEGTALNPFRLYLSIENRDNSPLKVETSAMSRMRIVEGGETTGIEDVVPSQQREDVIFDLSGRRVKQPVKGGVYIVNGKKRIL